MGGGRGERSERGGRCLPNERSGARGGANEAELAKDGVHRQANEKQGTLSRTPAAARGGKLKHCGGQRAPFGKRAFREASTRGRVVAAGGNRVRNRVRFGTRRGPCRHWDVFSHIDRARAYAGPPPQSSPFATFPSFSRPPPPQSRSLTRSTRSASWGCSTQTLNQHPVSPLVTATPSIWFPHPLVFSISLTHTSILCSLRLALVHFARLL